MHCKGEGTSNSTNTSNFPFDDVAISAYDFEDMECGVISSLGAGDAAISANGVLEF